VSVSAPELMLFEVTNCKLIDGVFIKAPGSSFCKLRFLGCGIYLFWGVLGN